MDSRNATSVSPFTSLLKYNNRAIALGDLRVETGCSLWDQFTAHIGIDFHHEEMNLLGRFIRANPTTPLPFPIYLFAFHSRLGDRLSDFPAQKGQYE